MPQKCPVKTDRKASLTFWHIGQSRTNIAHHRFPVFAALWMKLKFFWNDNYVLDRVV